jgi:hypothetical protein
VEHKIRLLGEVGKFGMLLGPEETPAVGGVFLVWLLLA